jgi:flagellar basal body rod protein FlgG
MTQLITVSRSYEALHNAIETIRDTERKAASDLGS